MIWKQKLIGKWSWKRPFISLAWIYVLLALFAYFFGSKLLFRPPHSGYAHDGLRYRSMENGVTPKIGYTWLAPHDDKSPVIFFSHGNAEDIADYEWLFDEWNQAGCGVFAYDYPGYGISEGSPTESSVNDATSKAWKYLHDSLRIPAERVIIVGRSVGCGPSLALAQKNEHAGVILISPFTSAFQSATRVPIFLGDMFPNEKVSTSLHSPLLIIHGENDRVIPCSQGRDLFDKSPSNNKTWLSLPNCGHNDIFDSHHDLLLEKITTFAETNSGE
jgi:alpha-beta hydrolase superfamily lysophospholipase